MKGQKAYLFLQEVFDPIDVSPVYEQVGVVHCTVSFSASYM
jgi:hypothetical protein